MSNGPVGFVLPLLSLGTDSLLIRSRRGFFPQPLPTDEVAQEPFIPQITIEENHTDELAITEHPVERGAPITDHAFKRPEQVTIRFAWSNSPSGPSSFVSSAVSTAANAGLGIANQFTGGLAGAVAGLAAAAVPAVSSILTGSAPQQVRDIYDRLLALQESCIPFDIITGKRSYSDMLFQSLATTTNLDTENSLVITAICRQVIIAETRVISTAINPNAQELPEITNPVVSTGPQQLQDAPAFTPGTNTLTGAVAGLGTDIESANSLLNTLPNGIPGVNGALTGALGQLSGVLSSNADFLSTIGSQLPSPQQFPLIGGVPQDFSIALGGALNDDLKNNLSNLAPKMDTLDTVINDVIQQLPSVQASLPPSFSGFGNLLQGIQDQTFNVVRLAKDVLIRNSVRGNVQGNKMLMRWNPVSRVWLACISDSAGNKTVSNIPLVVGSDLTEQFGHLGFAGQFFAGSDNSDSPPTFSNLGTTGHFYFVGP